MGRWIEERQKEKHKESSGGTFKGNEEVGLASGRRTTEQDRDPGCPLGGPLWSSEWQETTKSMWSSEWQESHLVSGSSQQRPPETLPWGEGSGGSLAGGLEVEEVGAFLEHSANNSQDTSFTLRIKSQLPNVASGPRGTWTLLRTPAPAVRSPT